MIQETSNEPFEFMNFIDRSDTVEQRGAINGASTSAMSVRSDLCKSVNL